MITGTTRTFALLGHPVGASPSPRMHNAWLRQHQVDGVYVALDVPASGAGGVVDAIRTLGLAGANVTVPLKEAIVGHLDRLEPSAAAARSVNTLYWDDGQLVGANTDGEGLVLSLAARGVAVGGRRVSVIGAGGAARGIAFALVAAGVGDLCVLNRTASRAQTLVDDLGRGRALPLDASLDGSDLVIVCTSAPPLGLERPDGAEWVDISTTTSAGLAMLCWQGALAFERWIGVRPDAEAARATLALPHSGDS